MKPDVVSSIVQGLLPSLQKAGEFKANALGSHGAQKQQTDVCQNVANGAMPKPGEVDDMVQVATVCLGQLATKATDIYQKLEPLIAPDTLIASGYKKLDRNCELAECISAFLDSETAFSSWETAIGKDLKLNTPGNATYAADMRALKELNALQKSADTIASDLQGYQQRLADLPSTSAEIANMGIHECSKFLDNPPPPVGGKKVHCIAIKSRNDAPRVYSNMATRSVAYSLNTFSLVSKAQEAAPDQSKKKLLANVSLSFAEKPKDVFRSSLRWEVSAGAFFSTLPIGSFSLNPVFAGTVVTDKKIIQNVLHPPVVPFAAAN